MTPADGRHLRDDQMIAVFIGAEPRFGRAGRSLAHLRACPACTRRYQALVGQFAELREDAADEADAIFTPERLEAQRQQILARLEHATHPARVLPFPSHGSPNLSIFTGSQVRRWIAAAAAAGLIIGITLGRVSDFGTPRPPQPVAVVPAQPRVVEAARQPDSKPTEEEIIWEAEQTQAADELQVPAPLEALSAITPIRDASLRLPPRH